MKRIFTKQTHDHTDSADEGYPVHQPLIFFTKNEEAYINFMSKYTL